MKACDGTTHVASQAKHILVTSLKITEASGYLFTLKPENVVLLSAVR